LDGIDEILEKAHVYEEISTIKASSIMIRAIRDATPLLQSGIKEEDWNKIKEAERLFEEAARKGEAMIRKALIIKTLAYSLCNIYSSERCVTEELGEEDDYRGS